MPPNVRPSVVDSHCVGVARGRRRLEHRKRGVASQLVPAPPSHDVCTHRRTGASERARARLRCDDTHARPHRRRSKRAVSSASRAACSSDARSMPGSAFSCACACSRELVSLATCDAVSAVRDRGTPCAGCACEGAPSCAVRCERGACRQQARTAFSTSAGAAPAPARSTASSTSGRNVHALRSNAGDADAAAAVAAAAAGTAAALADGCAIVGRVALRDGDLASTF